MNENTEYMLVHAALVVPAVCILLIAVASEIRKRAREGGVQVGRLRALSASLFALSTSALVGIAVGYTVMFGPSHLTGDFIGLPWYTMIPALIVGTLASMKTFKLITRRFKK